MDPDVHMHNDMMRDPGDAFSQQQSTQAAPQGSGPPQFMPNPSSFAPAQYQQFGSVPYINPTNVDPAQNQGFYDQYAQQLKTALQPTFQQQQQDLDASMAGRGIFNSGADIQANTQLQGQQAAAMANPLGALTQQFAGYNQQDVMANADAANRASDFNAGAYGSVVDQNLNNYNAFQNENYQNAVGYGNTLLGAYLGSYEPNYSAQSILSTGVDAGASAYGNVFGPDVKAGQDQQNNAFEGLMLAAGG